MHDCFSPIVQSRTMEAICHQIEALILEGVLRGGDRLPSERELATAMEVSRPVLRQAMAKLENDGLIVRQQGDGSYVAKVIGTVFSKPISKLLASHPKAEQDLLEFRLETEGMTAAFAAERATTDDHDRLHRLLGQMESALRAQDSALETDLDIAFHRAVGEMTYNLVFLHTLEACYSILEAGVFQSRQRLFEQHEGAGEQLFLQHQAIAKAITDGDPKQAQAAARTHIDYVCKHVEKIRKKEERSALSALRQRRLDQERS